MAKLEQLVTPLELLAAIKDGVLKSDIIKQYRTSDQELAVMLQPLYRAGKMTKDEFNDFFKGLSLKPPEPPPGEVSAPEKIPEQAPEPEPVPAPVVETTVQAEKPIEAPSAIEQDPVPGLEHASAELKRSLAQALVEEQVSRAAAPKIPPKAAAEPKPRPAAPSEPKPKPKPKDKPELKQQKEPAATARATAPKPARPPLKAVPAPPPSAARAEEAKVQPEAESTAQEPKEEATLDLITVTVEEPLLPVVDESAAPTIQTTETLRAILFRLDSIDERLSKIEKKLEMG
ncbi:MAG: hypothetical protein LDL33_06150 [Desulfomonile sp.]|nr:hypothetical protein [Desulfomonile sp.]